MSEPKETSVLRDLDREPLHPVEKELLLRCETEIRQYVAGMAAPAKRGPAVVAPPSTRRLIAGLRTR